MKKKQLLEKLKKDYEGHLKLKKDEETKGNPYAQAQAYGYLKQAVKEILVMEGIEIQS